MPTPQLHDEDWEFVRTLLPIDLEGSARAKGALIRCRNVPDAASLLRMALAYAVSDLSLKDVAAWASSLELATISGPGLFYRLRESEVWLEHVLAEILAKQIATESSAWPVRIVDATVINGPGIKAVQWRAHVLIEPVSGSFRSVELTDVSGGEKLSRYRAQPGEVLLGDRAYATARGIHSLCQAGAHVLVRFSPVTLRTFDSADKHVHLEEKEIEVPKVGAVEFYVNIPVPPKRTKSHKIWKTEKAIAWIPARAIAARTRTGDVIWLLTTLPGSGLSPAQAMALYRLRWQIETFFKRLKSLLHLDSLPSREGPTAKSWILARLIAAALAQQLVQPSGPLSPWGYELRNASLHA
jgi:hypothetical protein